jgi:hypothetical protein
MLLREFFIEQINELSDPLMNQRDPVIAVYDKKGKPIDRLNLSVAAQKYKFDPEFIRKQFKHQDQVRLDNVTLYAPIAGQPQEDLDEKQVWARSGKNVVRKYRCTSGNRKGRVVSKMSQCFAAPDIKKRATLKRTKARMGKRMARKARRSKRINPASIRLKSMNRKSRRR